MLTYDRPFPCLRIEQDNPGIVPLTARACGGEQHQPRTVPHAKLESDMTTRRDFLRRAAAASAAALTVPSGIAAAAPSREILRLADARAGHRGTGKAGGQRLALRPYGLRAASFA